ncbi:hypothetical protein J3R30DRAFT_3422083 [Lentinula aciculospora]|uniref:FHA domain-containing protein n=1 Tax=Lentinula aciculospora TaxID=153920 RepID=A0A9W9ATZ0_9AGAR|nr:hypothetical protein J3R30DRAFT_3422083 [Lentinula aciculospora]
MWIAQGFFDQDPAQATAIKSRLLKPGCSVAIGRKNQPLIINSKKISSEHCVLNVGAFSVEDVRDPEKRPSLQIFNPRDKTMSVRRNEEMISLNAKTTKDLYPGDELGLAHGIMVLLIWQPACYILRPTSSILASCSALGINVVQTLHPSVEYHITASYSPTPEIGTSLLSRCNFVKLEWLEKVIELCNNSDIPDYILPPISKYQPAFSPSLDPQHKSFNVWEPDQRRNEFFNGYRFLCVVEKDRDVASTLREFIARGSGAIETFCVSNGLPKWREALKRGVAKDAILVLVADEATVIAAAGESNWRDLREEASRYRKRFFSTLDLIQAVLNVDTTIFKIPAEDSSQIHEGGHSDSYPLPDCVPNSIPEEMTVPAPQPEEDGHSSRRRAPSRQTSEEPASQPRKPLTRRQASSQEPSSQLTQLQDDPTLPPRKILTRRAPPLESSNSQPTDTQPEDDPPPPPRKPLTRRVKAGVPVLSGLGDSSMMITAAVAASDPPIPSSSVPAGPMILDLTAPVPSRSSRLKRRLGADSGQLRSVAAMEAPFEEPVLKKFKALFEATNDPDQADVLMSQLPVDDNLSQTQSQSVNSVDTRKSNTTGRRTLDTISEDVQASQKTNAYSANVKGKKRKPLTDEEDMVGVEDEVTPRASKSRASSVAPPSKKQAIEKVNAVEPSSARPPSTTRTDKALGALPGEPDTDPGFLKAVASTKRGKKTEDDFDREFNKLKISKPELDRGKENPEDQWAILDDFSSDQNIRGNFMVIVEMDVYRDCFLDKRSIATNPEWDGQPNFKKFKAKDIRPRSKKIEVFVNENPDYLLEGDWKQNLSGQTQTESLSTGVRPSRSQNVPFLADDSDEEIPTKLRKNTSTAGKKVVTAHTKKSSGKTKPLFLDDDDDDVSDKPNHSDIEEFQEEQTSHSTERPARRTVPAKSKKPIIIDDDSDEDAFKGFKGRKRR